MFNISFYWCMFGSESLPMKGSGQYIFRGLTPAENWAAPPPNLLMLMITTMSSYSNRMDPWKVLLTTKIDTSRVQTLWIYVPWISSPCRHFQFLSRPLSELSQLNPWLQTFDWLQTWKHSLRAPWCLLVN